MSAECFQPSCLLEKIRTNSCQHRANGMIAILKENLQKDVGRWGNVISCLWVLEGCYTQGRVSWQLFQQCFTENGEVRWIRGKDSLSGSLSYLGRVKTMCYLFIRSHQGRQLICPAWGGALGQCSKLWEVWWSRNLGVGVTCGPPSGTPSPRQPITDYSWKEGVPTPNSESESSAWSLLNSWSMSHELP